MFSSIFCLEVCRIRNLLATQVVSETQARGVRMWSLIQDSENGRKENGTWGLGKDSLFQGLCG
jgi:hypothetical protein